MSDSDKIAAALIEVVEATRAYLPPDGIDAQECLNRILGATDNPEIAPIILKIEPFYEERNAMRDALQNIASGSHVEGLTDAILQGNASSTLAIVQQYARSVLEATS